MIAKSIFSVLIPAPFVAPPLPPRNDIVLESCCVEVVAGGDSVGEFASLGHVFLIGLSKKVVDALPASLRLSYWYLG